MTERETLIGRQIWTTVNEIAQQLSLEHPEASDDELMRLLVRELTKRIPPH
jgi:hypothetical protein